MIVKKQFDGDVGLKNEMVLNVMIRQEESDIMYLVFDVGATFVKYAWMSEEGNMKEKGKIPTRNKKGHGVSDFVDSLVEIYNRYKEKDIVQGIAMGLPGQIDVEKGIVYGGGGIKYLDGVPLGEILSKRCDNIRVSMENDGKCAALAEVWMGNAIEATNACVLVFGTGIGGGIVKDRKIYRGNHLLAGELSYCIEDMTREDLHRITPIEEIPGVVDSFHQMGFLWSARCSTSALADKVAEAKGMPFEEVNGELIYEWAAEGDKTAQDILEDMYFSIAKQCCNLYVILDPDIILIGGGISAQPAFIEGIRKYVNQLKRITKVYGGLTLDVCKYRNDSNLLGALYNFKQKYDMLQQEKAVYE